MKKQFTEYYLKQGFLMLVLFCCISVFGYAQEMTIRGVVTDESNSPLPGVSVMVKGTMKGTVTDIDGKYSINSISEDDVLVLSFIGYATQEVSVNGRTTINISLSEDVQRLDEVVVVGYGTSSKKKLTTSVTSIGADQMEELPITTIADAFSGQMSGVLAESGTGTPGALPVIRIRGYGSINAGSEPLYIIDGMTANSSQFAALNPKTVKSIDVLKDAAAGAIYGSRAGNGVIIVTTKKGEQGKAQFSFNATYGLQQPANKVDVLDRDQWLSMVKESYNNLSMEIPDFYDRPSSNFANTNWQDEIFRTSPYQNYQISATGGSENVKYYLSANVLDNEGFVLTTYHKNYSSNGNFDIELDPKLKIGLSYMASIQKERVNQSMSGWGHGRGGYGISGGIIQQALWFSPVIPVYLENGDYGQNTQGEFAPYFPSKGYANPVANLKETHDIWSRRNFMGRMYLEYEIMEGLSLNSSFSGTMNSYFRDWHVSPYLSGNASTLANFSNPVYEKISAGQANGETSSWRAESYLDYFRTMADDHDFHFILGVSREYFGTRRTNARSSVNDRGSSNALDPIDAYDNYYQPSIYGAALVLGGGNFGENSFESLFSRLNYSYKDKYLFMGSIRRDGSSKFAPSERYGTFTALSAGWRISEESFMESFSWLDDFKLRMSYGISGNDQFGNYAWQGNVNYNILYTYGPMDLGGAGTQRALTPSTIENNHLKWETNEQFNLGLDLSIVKNRINLSTDYFIRTTRDMLLYRNIPLENGITASMFDNVGNMTNNGIEIALNTVNVKSNNFTWSTNLTFTKINNKVKDVFTSTGEIHYHAGTRGAGFASAIRIIENRPMFEIYSYKVLGTFETQELLDNYPGAKSPGIGSVIIEDYNDDGKINTDDLQPMGNALPDFTYGFTSNLRFFNFDLNIIIDGSHGASKVITALRQAGLIRSGENTLQTFYDDRYREGETGHNFAKAWPLGGSGNSGARHWNMSYFVHDASFLRIKNLTLGYNVPTTISDKLKINSLRAYLGVQNLHTFTNYPLFNPQANTNAGNPGTAQFGVDMAEYPLARTYTVGINLNF